MFRKIYDMFLGAPGENIAPVVAIADSVPIENTVKSPTVAERTPTLAERLEKIEFPPEKIPAELTDNFLTMEIIKDAVVLDYMHVMEQSEFNNYGKTESIDPKTNEKTTSYKNPVTREFCSSYISDKTINMQSERFVLYQELLHRHKIESSTKTIDIHQRFNLKQNQQLELQQLTQEQIKQIQENYQTIEQIINSILDGTASLLHDGPLNPSEPLPSEKTKEKALNYYFARLNSLEEEKRKLVLGDQYYTDKQEIVRRVFLQVEKQEHTKEDELQLKEMLNEYENCAFYISNVQQDEIVIPKTVSDFVEQKENLNASYFANYFNLFLNKNLLAAKQQSSQLIIRPEMPSTASAPRIA